MNTYSLSNGTALTRSSSRAELFTSGVKVSFAGVPIFDSTSTSGYSHAVQQTWEANGSVKKRKRLWLCSADGSPILDGPNAGAVVYAGSRPD
jgi:hypothetical protein